MIHIDEVQNPKGMSSRQVHYMLAVCSRIKSRVLLPLTVEVFVSDYCGQMTFDESFAFIILLILYSNSLCVLKTSC